MKEVSKLLEFVALIISVKTTLHQERERIRPSNYSHKLAAKIN